MTEIFEIFDESGEPLGTAPRDRVHRQGLWHRSVNVFVFRPDGRLLLQRRHAAKDVCPGAWDVSVAEHVKIGETFAAAAKRGLAEELGITSFAVTAVGGVVPSRLELAGSGVKDYEFQQCFRVVTDAEISPATDEVADCRLVDLDALRRAFAERPGDYTPWLRERALELDIV